MSHNYPRTVTEVLNADKKYKPAVLRAVRAFRASKPWRGTIVERQEKFHKLYADLAQAYGIPEPCLMFETDETKDSGSSAYYPALRTVVLRGRLSVLTALHEFAHVLHGRSERTACRWSINLFARIFPRSFSRCRSEGHTLRTDGQRASN